MRTGSGSSPTSAATSGSRRRAHIFTVAAETCVSSRSSRRRSPHGVILDVGLDSRARGSTRSLSLPRSPHFASAPRTRERHRCEHPRACIERSAAEPRGVEMGRRGLEPLTSCVSTVGGASVPGHLSATIAHDARTASRNAECVREMCEKFFGRGGRGWGGASSRHGLRARHKTGTKSRPSACGISAHRRSRDTTFCGMAA